MKRRLLSTFATLAAALVLMSPAFGYGGGSDDSSREGSSRGGGSHHSRGGNGGGDDQGRSGRDDQGGQGDRGDRGDRDSGSSEARPQARAAAHNGGFVRGVDRIQRTETKPHHYYWHNERGVRYTHYFDGRNHWFGFNHGPKFYWTRYYGSRWWFFDAHAARWVFWGNGFWWWAGPGGVPYIYADNNYYPYENPDVIVENEDTAAPPASVPAPSSSAANGGASSISPDKSRMVQVFGDGSQAFLYDQTTDPPKFMKYLGQGVTKVRYSGGTANAPLQIMVEYKDGTFALFDASGDSQSDEVKSDESGVTPPAAPDSIPPPPTSAPGE